MEVGNHGQFQAPISNCSLFSHHIPTLHGAVLLPTLSLSHLGFYFSGDGALRDEEGHYRITGRVDDMINSKGHIIGTAELECAMVNPMYFTLVI